MKKNQKTALTRHDEVKKETSSQKEMLNNYLAEDLKRKWSEDFIDEDTGETVSVERNEMIAEKGRLIDSDLLSQISFFQQSGDIDKVKISNQPRMGSERNYDGLSPWSVTISFDKKKKILLYANSIEMAIEVVRDWTELNFSGAFIIENIRGFQECIILKDMTRLEDSENEDEFEERPERKFYKVEVRVITDTVIQNPSFIVNTVNVDTAMIFIKEYLRKAFEEKAIQAGTEIPVFSVSLESAVVISCSYTIEKEFSMAYLRSYSEYKTAKK